MDKCLIAPELEPELVKEYLIALELEPELVLFYSGSPALSISPTKSICAASVQWQVPRSTIYKVLQMGLIKIYYCFE